MTDQPEQKKPNEKAHEGDKVEKSATVKESRENFTGEQQAKRYKENFTSLSDGTTAVAPLVMEDSKTGKVYYDARQREGANGSGILDKQMYDEQSKKTAIRPPRLVGADHPTDSNDNVPKGSAEDRGLVIDYEPKMTGPNSFSAGIDLEEGPEQIQPGEPVHQVEDIFDSETIGMRALTDPRLVVYDKTLKEMPADDPGRIIVKESATDVVHGKFREQALTNTLAGWIAAAQKIAQLPPDKQLEVLGSGLSAGLSQYSYEQRERNWGSLIGTVDGAGEVATNLAKIADFAAYCIIGDDDRAGKMGEEFGTALGQTIVGGVRLFQAADQYLVNIGFTGDYAKPFSDVVVLGQALDDKWNDLTPREQESLQSKLITELIAEGLVGAGGVTAIKKASKFTEILDTVAIEGGDFYANTRAAGKRAIRAIGDVVDEILHPVGDTGTGIKMPIPKDRVSGETNLLMSKADDAEGKGFRHGEQSNRVNANDKFKLLEDLLIDEKPSKEVIEQCHPNACVSACGEMLTNGKMHQAALVKELLEYWPAELRKRNMTADLKWLPREIGETDWGVYWFQSGEKFKPAIVIAERE